MTLAAPSMSVAGSDATQPADAPAADPMPRAAALPTLSMLAITLVWGVSFILTKDVIVAIPPADFLAERFAAATALMLALRPRALRGLSRAGWRHGILIGLILSFSYLTQTYGLRTTPASVSAFITGLFVVFTPLLGALVLRNRIAPTAWAATGLSVTGLGLLSLGTPGGGNLAASTGELLTLACAFGWAAHITATDAWARQHDPYALSIVQLAVVAVVCLLIALPGGIARGSVIALPKRPADWFVLAFTTLLCTAAGFFVQTFAQRHISPTRTAVIMTMEPVFAGLSGAVSGERLPGRGYFGAALVLAAIYLVELHRPRGAPAGSKPALPGHLLGYLENQHSLIVPDTGRTSPHVSDGFGGVES